MNYLNNSKKTLDDLMTLLKSSLSNNQPEFTIHESDHPVLTMETDLELAGFCIIPSNEKENFECFYHEFKKIYKKNVNRWARVNVSFVYCFHDIKSISKEMIAKIETDLFFCRKFVITYTNDKFEGLSKLPFIPIESAKGAVPNRIVPAQSLLEKLGVTQDLAKSLTTLNSKKSQTIVDNCLLLTEVPRLEKLTDEIYQNANTEVRQNTRIKSLVIENFRAYKNSHRFDLNADLIVLYGPNGLGKTSFFDSIDFVTTGGCGRFKGFEGGENSFRSSARHLDSDGKESFVELEIETESGPKKIKRYTESHLKATFDGNQLDRTSLLFEITNAGDGFERRVETIINLFRATHLFGQDFQTLTEDFGKKSFLSDEIVSRMLAFQDYVRSDIKLAEIISILRQNKRSLDSEHSSFREQINITKSKIDSMQISSETLTNSESLSAWIDDLVARYAYNTELPKRKSTDTDKEYLKILVSIVEALIKEEKSRLEVLVRLIDSYMDYKDDQELLRQKINTEMQIKTLIADRQQLIDSEAMQLASIETDNKHRIETEKNLIAYQDSLNWLKVSIPKYEASVSQQNFLNLEIDKLAPLKITLEKNLYNKKQVLLSLEAKVKKLDSDLKVNRDQKNTLTNLVFEFNQQLYRNNELLAIQSARNSLLTEVEKLNKQKTSEKEKYDEQVIRHAKLIDEINSILRFESELAAILQELKSHVNGPDCPACGTNHGSVNELTTKISARSNVKSSEFRNKEIEKETLSKELISKNILLKEFEEKIFYAQTQLTALNSQMVVNKSKSEEFEKEILKVGIAYKIESVESDLESLVGDFDAKLVLLEKEILETHQSISGQIPLINVEENELKKSSSLLEEMEKKLRIDQNTISTFLSEVARRGIDNTLEKMDVDLQLFDISEKIKHLRSQISDGESKINDKRALVSHCAIEMSQLNQNLKITVNERELSQRKVTIYRTDLIKSGFDEKATIEEISLKRKEIDSSNLAKEIFIENLLTVSTALDATEASNELLKLNGELRKLQDSLKKISSEREFTVLWTQFFEDLNKILNEVKNNSVDQFTQKYGPISTLIQSRLRSVFGFGEILMKAQDGNIAVKVSRDDKQLRPIDYFSESQKQILVLSLFFASALTQNWSSFAPILLDDPVTHFDDLNAYAFLDLISGMVQTETNRRQFIISTCDDKLYHLMRQKFYNFGSKVKIYEFKSIGSDGPQWTQIANGSSELTLTM